MGEQAGAVGFLHSVQGVEGQEVGESVGRHVGQSRPEVLLAVLAGEVGIDRQAHQTVAVGLPAALRLNELVQTEEKGLSERVGGVVPFETLGSGKLVVFDVGLYLPQVDHAVVHLQRQRLAVHQNGTHLSPGLHAVYELLGSLFISRWPKTYRNGPAFQLLDLGCLEEDGHLPAVGQSGVYFLDAGVLHALQSQKGVIGQVVRIANLVNLSPALVNNVSPLL